MSAAKAIATPAYERAAAALRKEYVEVIELEHDSGFLVRAKSGSYIVLDASGEKLKW